MTPSSSPSSPVRARTVLVVPHTHWDREWYRPFEDYRYRLMRALDGVLDGGMPYFLLDGQTAVVDDYLALRPERRDQLKAGIAAGRLGFGPWYVLVDEFLVSGEALVRNLLTGRAAMREMGVPAGTTSVGYLPDMFGHVAQMPQILRGFGLDKTVVWRGARPSAPRFVWRGPDGSTLDAAWLPQGYYQTLFMEELDDAARRKQLDAYVAAFGDQDPVWLLSGADHMAPRADLAEQLARLAGGETNLAPRVARLDEIFVGDAPAAELSGELREPVGLAYVLPGVLSARTYLKQANFRAQRSLERLAEPLAARAWWGGHAWAGMDAALGQAWRTLMMNHPHDSICGCSIDQVHREMILRFDAVAQLTTMIADDAVRAATRPEAEPCLWVYNPAGTAFAGWVDVEILWPRTDDLAGPAAVALLGPDGLPVPTVLLAAAEDTEVFRAEIDFNPDWFKVRRYSLAARVELPATGGLKLRAVDAAGVAMPAPGLTVTATDYGIENEHLALRVVDERIDLVDKANGRVYHDVQAFLDEGDAGDEYNFSPLAGDKPRRALMLSATVVEAGPHRATLEVCWSLRVPTALSADRSTRGGSDADLGPVTRFTLEAGGKLVSARTAIQNNAADHRLRLVVGGARAAAAVWAEGMYGVFRREPAPAPVLPVEKRTEAVMPEFPMGRFTALVDDAGGLVVAGAGLHEAAVLDGPDGRALAVTLLRAVGWLSRDDLRTRGGGAGPRFPTPEAQCPGPHTFEHALMPLTRGWQDALAPVEGWFAPPAAWSGSGPAAGETLVAWDGAGLQLSALKRSVDGEALVLRLFNPGPEPVAGRLRVLVPHGGVATADLAEVAGEQLGAGDIFDAPFGPYEIRTWRISRS